MEQSVKQLRDWAMKADNNKFFKRAASMQIKLDKMERVDKPSMKQNMKLSFQQTERSGKITIKASNLSKSFEQKSLFHNAEMVVHYGERVALIGPNGCGKTTFLKMLLGEELPDEGSVQLGANVLAAYLPQTVTFPDEEFTVLDYFREDLFILEGKAREYLAKFMFYGGNVYKKIKLLSGGERLRLKLSKLLYNDINLVILDEPTNHLDTKSIESMEEALAEFKGTIFFISHDRYFINKISDRVIAIEDGALNSYLGNYDYYKSIKDKQNQQVKEVLPTKTVQQSDKRKNDRKQEPSKVVDRKEKDAVKLENRIRDMEDRIKEIEESMKAMGSDYEGLNRLYEQKEGLSKELEEVMEMWLRLNED
jgi:ATPase subunit of ABC transporter with duplicated ATPase domains